MSESDLSNPMLDVPANVAENPVHEAVSVDVIDSNLTVLASPESVVDWETLSFPQTLDVDQLPEGESIDLVTSLEQQNATLRDRVDYLESALEQSQTTLRQELEQWQTVARSGDERIQEKDVAIAQHIAEITAAQEKITQLFQDLEVGHTTTQRQQILIDALNGQLVNSQERVAQLERECSLTQQRYVEQAQLAMQKDHQSRDLQARLYRQQRYTLQYKAALEKCLEVPEPGAQQPTLMTETLNPTSTGVGKQVNMPKPMPVQPWSAPQEDAEDPAQGAWLNSFLSDSEQFPNTEAVSNFTWQADIEPQKLSFELDGVELRSDLAEELRSIDPRLVAWEPVNPVESVESAPDVANLPSPFITLQPMSEQDLAEAGDVPVRKRESLAAVDLPSFPKVSEMAASVVSAANSVVQQTEKKE
jgi:hypothetical protein